MIELQLRNFLAQVRQGEASLSEELIKEFARDAEVSMRKHMVPEPRRYSYRMSAAGKPLCQLQREQLGMDKEAHEFAEYNSAVRMTYGDILEDMIFAFMKGAGINVEGTQGKVSIPFADFTMNGTWDCIIDGKIWDVKSASPFVYREKFAKGYEEVKAGDTFGYVTQGHLYSEGQGIPFGGWIVIEKSSGEICVVEVPESFAADRPRVMQEVEDKWHKLQEMKDPNHPLVESFESYPETFRKAETGNHILKFGSACYFCDYKRSCKNATHEPSKVSAAVRKPFVWYTNEEKHRDESIKI